MDGTVRFVKRFLERSRVRSSLFESVSIQDLDSLLLLLFCCHSDISTSSAILWDMTALLLLLPHDVMKIVPKTERWPQHSNTTSDFPPFFALAGPKMEAISIYHTQQYAPLIPNTLYWRTPYFNPLNIFAMISRAIFLQWFTLMILYILREHFTVHLVLYRYHNNL